MLHFRLKVLLDGIQLQGGLSAALKLTVSAAHSVAVAIERCELHGLPPGASEVAVATVKVNANDKVTAGFQSLSQLRLPDAVPAESLPNWRRFQEADGRLKADTLLPRSGLPPSMISFIDQIAQEMVQAVKRACLILRWRFDLDGSHNPLRSLPLGAEWSLDGETWLLLPDNTSTRLIAVPSVYGAPEVADEVQALLDAGMDEPIAHQLYREAWGNRFTNRRSAVVIGVAALEVGLKAFLSRLMPPAEWLITSLPSPPVKRILLDYLPTLATPLPQGGKPMPPPKVLLDRIDKAITLRNRIAHATGQDVAREGLEEMLEAIKELLWLLDYYAGSSWALEHLTAETRAAMNL